MRTRPHQPPEELPSAREAAFCGTLVGALHRILSRPRSGDEVRGWGTVLGGWRSLCRGNRRGGKSPWRHSSLGISLGGHPVPSAPRKADWNAPVGAVMHACIFKTRLLGLPRTRGRSERTQGLWRIPEGPVGAGEDASLGCLASVGAQGHQTRSRFFVAVCLPSLPAPATCPVATKGTGVHVVSQILFSFCALFLFLAVGVLAFRFYYAFGGFGVKF